VKPEDAKGAFGHGIRAQAQVWCGRFEVLDVEADHAPLK
jgi:hypothetical protein